MVNVIIYLEKTVDPLIVVNQILKEKLISNASIDIENENYKLVDNKLTKTINTVITCQTKSLLFTKIVQLIASEYGDNVPIYSIPVTQSNESFDLFIRNNTVKI